MILINPASGVDPDYPNIGLAYISTILNSKVIDLNTKPFPKDRYLNYKENNVFISVRPFTLHKSEIIEKRYKKKYLKSAVKSVTGIIDVFCCYPFMKLKQNLNIKTKFSDNLPFPKYELFDSFSIFRKNWKSGKWLYPLTTGLGCPYQCTYCESKNRKWIPRSAKNCYEELKHAKKRYGIKSFATIDDCFNFDKKRILEFCKLIKPLNLSWVCTNGLRADRFDKEIAKAMLDAGCIQVGFGVECLDDDVLGNIKKGETAKQIKTAVSLAKRYFKRIHCFFIIGLPGSSYKKDLNSLKWVIKEGIAGHFSFYVPFGQDYQKETFYGINASAKSNEYSRKKQEYIYKLTRFMRDDIKAPFVFRALNRLKLIWMFDRKNIFYHIMKQLRIRFINHKEVS